MPTPTSLTAKIPPGHVMLLYWVRMPGDSRDCAGNTGHVIIPARGCLNRAREIDTYGDRDLHDSQGRGCVAAGHGVTILWPSGRQREVRAND